MADERVPEMRSPGVRHPDAPAPGQRIDSHYHLCFGCGSDHPTGLHLAMTAGEGVSVHAEFDVGASHQGAPGIAHGGLLTAAFDEALSAVTILMRKPAVTVDLRTSFLKPVPVGSRVSIHAECTGVAGRRIFTKAEGRLGDSAGPIAVTVTAVFVEVPLEHFFTQARAEDVVAAAERDEVQARTRWLTVSP